MSCKPKTHNTFKPILFNHFAQRCPHSDDLTFLAYLVISSENWNESRRGSETARKKCIDRPQKSIIWPATADGCAVGQSIFWVELVQISKILFLLLLWSKTTCFFRAKDPEVTKAYQSRMANFCWIMIASGFGPKSITEFGTDTPKNFACPTFTLRSFVSCNVILGQLSNEQWKH